MAESTIAVTEGAGKKIHSNSRSIGGNTVEDQVTVNGEQYLASYTVVTGTALTTGTANAHLLQIMAGASLNVRIRRIEVHQAAAATAAALADIRCIRLTTAGTGGTAITPSKLNNSDAASGATAMTLPTVKGTEGNHMALARAYLMQTIAASAQQVNPIIVWDFDRPRSQPLIIAAGTGNGICISHQAAYAGATVQVFVWFDESNF